MTRTQQDVNQRTCYTSESEPNRSKRAEYEYWIQLTTTYDYNCHCTGYCGPLQTISGYDAPGKRYCEWRPVYCICS
jgi:hypothetical protein